MKHLLTNSACERSGSAAFFAIAAVCLAAGLSTLVFLINDPPAAPASTADSDPGAASAGRHAYTTKLIEDVEAGDLVMARDSETGELAQKRVVHAFRRTSQHLRILRVESTNGEQQRIETTNEHPFWVSGRGFVSAKNLRPGDRLDDATGESGAVVASNEYEAHPEGIEVCNFEVEDLHTYFVRAGGTRGPPLFVHNNTCDEAGDAAGAAKKVNLNTDDAVSNFGLYEVHINGSIYKVGKTDLVRLTKSSGLPTRLHQQVRKLEKVFGKGNVVGKVVEDLGQTTTKAAKQAEHARILDSFQTTGFVPLGNWKSFRP